MVDLADKVQLAASADLDLQMINFATATMGVELQGEEVVVVLYYE